jgi:hypothetical protein
MSAQALTERDWLGDIPRPVVTTGRPAKAHTGRMRKVHCQRCGCIVYASRGALQRSGLPVCGCGDTMQLANLRDRAIVEWDALTAELESYGRDTYDAAMRELGYTDMIAPRRAPRRSGAAQNRCEWEGGYCVKFVVGRYCPEHEIGRRPEMSAASRRMV